MAASLLFFAEIVAVSVLGGPLPHGRAPRRGARPPVGPRSEVERSAANAEQAAQARGAEPLTTMWS